MRPNFIIAIVSITEYVGHGSYVAEDVFDGSEIRVSISGKMRMAVLSDLDPKDKCVVQYSPYDVSRGRIINKTSLKEDQRTFGGYLDVKKKNTNLSSGLTLMTGH